MTILDIKSRVVDLIEKFDQSKHEKAGSYIKKLQSFYDRLSKEPQETAEAKDWETSNLALWEKRFEESTSFYSYSKKN